MKKSRKHSFSERAWEDYLFWQKHSKAKVKRINLLIQAAKRTPFSGVGKPEGLKNEFAGLWSRRIDEEHRLIYRVTDDEIEIVACRFHY